jgi:tetratricopeptide (TPR) repeat protein
LFVIARASAFSIASTSDDVLEIAEKLGVRYITQGAIAFAGNQLRVDVALIEAPSRTEIWVERFDRELSEIFEVQQEISYAIVGYLQLEIETAEQKRALMRPDQTLDAWGAYHRGVWHMYKFKAEDFSRAEKLFERALELNPNDARIYANLSFIEFQRAFRRLEPDYAAALQRAQDLANKSVAIDPREPLGHWALGRTLLMYREYDQSLEELEAAIDLNPNFAGAHFFSQPQLFRRGRKRTRHRGGRYGTQVEPL